MQHQTGIPVPRDQPRHRLFPLVRLISRPIAPVVAVTPVTPNQLTWLSLSAGLGAAAMIAMGDKSWKIGGAFVFVVCYLLDNLDGEIARLKNLTSRFGATLDTVADWLVHSVLFVTIGLEHSRATGQEIWLWLGLAAAAGGTINYGIGRTLERAAARKAKGEPAIVPRRPLSLQDWMVYGFRELSRADFCFLLLLLSVFDLIWLLLPAAAIGAQVYWLLIFVKGARDYHV